MRVVPVLVPLAVTAILCAIGRPARAADPHWGDREIAVRKALKSDDPKERARAFDPLRETDDPRAVDLVVEGVLVVRAEQERITKAQKAQEQAYEQVMDNREKNRKQLANSSKSGKDIERYNANERKLTKAIEAALEKLRDLENDFLRTRGQLDNATMAVGVVLSRVPTEDLMPSLAKLETAWLRSKSPEDPILYIDAIAGLDRPWVSKKLGDVVRDTGLPIGLRSAALTALAGRKDDPTVVDLAVPWLSSPPDLFVGIAAAIEALRLRHDVRGIEPLIEFLKREDVKRLREDAQRALQSLTGQEHGPYFDPWNTWWKDAKATFAMPPSPVARKRGQEQGGVTFYGIHTFSNRILFVLDISGSMDQSSKAGPEGQSAEPRIAVARRELAGAINSMDSAAPGSPPESADRFNVILFNHAVIPWQVKMTEVTEATKKQAIRWATSQEPLGGTNIHDALEAGFHLASRVSGRPELDTIMFLTDGRPTAGRLQDPKAILEAVREWNRTLHLTIHCIGIGEHDEAFLSALAAIGHGDYVKR